MLRYSITWKGRRYQQCYSPPCTPYLWSVPLPKKTPSLSTRGSSMKTDSSLPLSEAPFQLSSQDNSVPKCTANLAFPPHLPMSCQHFGKPPMSLTRLLQHHLNWSPCLQALPTPKPSCSSQKYLVNHQM